MMLRGGLEQSVDNGDGLTPCRSTWAATLPVEALYYCEHHFFGLMMTTRLEKTLKRQLTLDGRTFILAMSPEGLRITLKGKRKGLELRWSELVSGQAALAVALNASVGRFELPSARPEADIRPPPVAKKSTRGRRQSESRRPSKRHRARSKSPRG
jgi:hypothetical protein